MNQPQERFAADQIPTDAKAPNSSNTSHDSRAVSGDDGGRLEPVRTADDDDDDQATRTAGFQGLQRTPTKTNPEMSLWREVLLVFICCGCQFMTQATLGQAMAPLQIIGRDFGTSMPGELSWFIASFSLTVGTFILPAGRLGDMFGHKLMLVTGYAWLAGWSLITGFTAYAHSQIFFDICRAMQGIACSILLPNGLAILGTTYPPGRRKTIVFSIFGGTAPTGFLFGSLFAGLVAQLAWWPWAFWLSAIVTTGLALIGFFVIPNKASADDTSSAHGTQKFDYWGTALGVAGLILFNVAWNQAPNDGWETPYVLVLLILGVLLFVAFVFVEYRVDQPLVPMESIQGKSGLVLACVMLGWSSFGIWLYYFWQFSLNIRENTPLNIVAQSTVTSPAGWCAAGVVAVLISRVRASWLMMAAMFAFCLGNVLFATNDPERLYWKQTFWALIVTPFGMDISFPAATLILSNLAHKRHQGKAASLVTTVVNYSIAFGLGIAGTVEVHVNNGGMNKIDLLKGYRGAWYAAIGLSGLGIVCAGFFVMTDQLQDRREKTRDSEKAGV